MFEIESKKQDEIKISIKNNTISVDVAEGVVEAGLAVGAIAGPGEFEIGEAAILGIGVGNEKTIYVAEIGGVRIGIVGGIEEKLDELGMVDILCTSSTKAVKEVSPKLVVAMGNLDGMVSELKLTARAEKKLKIKNADSLPTTLEVVALS